MSDQARLFFELIDEDRFYSIDDCLQHSLNLLRNNPSMRFLVLDFYQKLFDEYLGQYCLFNKSTSITNEMRLKKIDSNQEKMIDKFCPTILSKFIKSFNKTVIKQESNDDYQKLSISSENLDIVEDCPQSPPTEDMVQDYDLDDVSLNFSLQNDMMTIMNLIEKNIPLIQQTLFDLLIEEKLFSVAKWSLDFIIKITIKYSLPIDYENIQASDSMTDIQLNQSLSFWKQCPLMKILIELVAYSIENNNQCEKDILKIQKFSPKTDWIVANLFESISNNLILKKYIEVLINSSSSSSSNIFILSYLFKHNPYAIVDCSKTNLPFLLKLCACSKPLLDLLANEAAKKGNNFHRPTQFFRLTYSYFFLIAVDLTFLNNVIEKKTLNGLDNEVILCFLNASNCYELLIISIRLYNNDNATDIFREKIGSIWNLLMKRLHQFVYEPNYSAIDLTLFVLSVRKNVNDLIEESSQAKDSFSKRFLCRLITLISIHFGEEFLTEVFHHLFNVNNPNFNLQNNWESPKINNIIMTVYNALRLHFGVIIQQQLMETINFFSSKRVSFWMNFYAFNEIHPIQCLDLNQFVQHLTQKGINPLEEHLRNYYIFKIIIKLSDSNVILKHQTRFLLILAIVKVYVEIMKILNADIYLEKFLMIILLNCLKYSRILLKNLCEYSMNEAFIGSILVEIVQKKSSLFSSTVKHDDNQDDRSAVRLYDQIDDFFDFRHKIFPKKLRPSINENKLFVFNRFLLMDLIHSCCKDKSKIAYNLLQLLPREALMKEKPSNEDELKFLCLKVILIYFLFSSLSDLLISFDRPNSKPILLSSCFSNRIHYFGTYLNRFVDLKMVFATVILSFGVY